MAMGYSMNSNVLPLDVVMEELSILPIEAIAAFSRTRAFLKYPTLKTWIRTLIDYPLRYRKRMWVNTSLTWLKTYASGEIDFTNPKGSASKISEIVFSRRVKKSLIKKTSARIWYDNGNFAKSKHWFFTKTASDAQLARGVLLIARCRTRTFWTTRLLAKCKLISDFYLNNCPFCKGEVKESIEHLLIECPNWGGLRKEYLKTHMDRITSSLKSCELTTRTQTFLLLGGEYGGNSTDFVSSDGLQLRSLTIFLMKVTALRAPIIKDLREQHCVVDDDPSPHYDSDYATNGLSPTGVG